MPAPINIRRDLRSQLPQAGRIRAGRKVVTQNGKTAPSKLRNFRFTSPDRRSLEQVASLYGGDVAPWSDPLAAPGQFEVITEVNEINVVLPADPLSDTVYELWSGGGCQRRCDGETVTLPRGGGDLGAEPTEEDCICARKGVLECKLTTRLSVILPEVRFLGLWRLDTKGINAAKELPGMVATIQALQGSPGFTSAILRLEQRTVRRVGQKPSQFVVPVLGLANTPMELVAGEARMQPELPSVDAAASACPGCQSVFSQHWLDCPNRDLGLDDVIDAEVLELEPGPVQLTEFAGAEPGPTDPEGVVAWLQALSTHQQAKILMRARAKAEELRMEPPQYFDQLYDNLELADQIVGNGTP